MFQILLILFLTIPVIEIILLFKVGESIGAWWTILLIILTAVIGANLLRIQGLATFQRFQSCLQRGELPAATMIEGVLLLLAGAFLLTPGFFTDSIGFLLLIFPVRRFLATLLIRRGLFMVAGRTGQQQGTPGDPGRTIEGEYERKDE